MLLSLVHKILRARFQAMGFVSETLSVPSGTLHYLVHERHDAQGTLVLVHGLGTSSSTWSLVLSRLPSSYRIVAVDLPGFGFSTVGNGRGYCTLSEHCEALSILIAKRVEPPVVLLGHSLGGWISSRHAASAPERVHQLVLVDTAGMYYEGAENLRDLFTVRSVRDTRRLLNELWFRYPWYFKPFAPGIYEELKERRMGELVASIRPSDALADELSRLTMPVSIIWGEQDAIIPVQCAGMLSSKIPNAIVHIIPRCGHVPQLERPKAFAALVRQVLG